MSNGEEAQIQVFSVHHNAIKHHDRLNFQSRGTELISALMEKLLLCYQYCSVTHKQDLQQVHKFTAALWGFGERYFVKSKKSLSDGGWRWTEKKVSVRRSCEKINPDDIQHYMMYFYFLNDTLVPHQLRSCTLICWYLSWKQITIRGYHSAKLVWWKKTEEILPDLKKHVTFPSWGAGTLPLW